ncbi:helix-turn-helix transcriptional regulator [Hyphomicrobium sp. CS1BSMeth3]|uniref:helix-turn-helix domain-containing protein n=1 Tax=Hyphomicrobium sp. CS1BSMeth3 TaxID=1892844 RepID=UPI000930D322|nr:helix-turn-helix transcriptional regulator [Hyphomicrobium sp. CS1BSMeth3]
MPSTLRSSRHRALMRRLIELRKSRGLTQTEVARRLSKPQSFVAKIETGERRLDVIEFIDIAHALDIEPVDLIAELAARPLARKR